MTINPKQFSIYKNYDKGIITDNFLHREYCIELFLPEQHLDFVKRIEEYKADSKTFCVVNKYRIIATPKDQQVTNSQLENYDGYNKPLGEILSIWISEQYYNAYCIYCRASAYGRVPLDAEFSNEKDKALESKQEQSNNKLILIVLGVILLVLILWAVSDELLGIILSIICFFAFIPIIL